jgi:sugar O-acyltransferase (sialic acid O-acetyltransferase NeuD family)
VAEPIFLFGVGGHARSVYEVAARQGEYEVVAVLDDDPVAREFRGIEVVGGRERLASLAEGGPGRGVIAIGANSVRRELAALVEDAGLSLVAVVDPAAVVARDVEVGDGTVVMPGVVVNVGTTVGRNVILNTACTVDHDCRIGDFAHLSPGVHVSGECEIGDGAHVGIGASVLQRVQIGDGATVGAGAAVTKAVPPGAVVVGVPARELER